jgi:hypothetical protein
MRMPCQSESANYQNEIVNEVNNGKCGVNNTNAIVCIVKISKQTMANAV